MTPDLTHPQESEAPSAFATAFPAIFAKAKDARLWDDAERAYIDFFSGGGALNYGHNPTPLKDKLLAYLQDDGVVHGPHMATHARQAFLDTFKELILAPRELEYQLQFTGATGANAVEAALKFARQIKKRPNVIAFTNGFHGMKAGTLAASGAASFRNANGISLSHIYFMPYDGYFGKGIDTIEHIERLLSDKSSGFDTPAAAIVETVQVEGGVNVASAQWLNALEQLCRRHDMLLVVDDMQVGCGRTGGFFSFEAAHMSPDIVTLSKSLSGCGLPLSLMLLRPELARAHADAYPNAFAAAQADAFCGDNLALVGATEALTTFWHNDAFGQQIYGKEYLIRSWVKRFAEKYPEIGLLFRGRGLISGLSVSNLYAQERNRPAQEPAGKIHQNIARRAFANGLIIDTAGIDDQVLKLLPPLTIDDEQLQSGLDILEQSITAELGLAGRSDVNLKRSAGDANEYKRILGGMLR